MVERDEEGWGGVRTARHGAEAPRPRGLLAPLLGAPHPLWEDSSVACPTWKGIRQLEGRSWSHRAQVQTRFKSPVQWAPIVVQQGKGESYVTWP